MKRSPSLMDVTVRDGSFANKEAFTTEFVANLVGRLQTAGLEWIEIGHGYGLGAERAMYRLPGTDAEYLEAVSRVRNGTSRFGMFANANISADEDIITAESLGLDFIRIGFIGRDGPHPLAVALRLLSTAKTLGLWASVNIIRTQMYSSRELAALAREIADAGADCIYVVDSPGGAVPSQVRTAVSVIKDNCALPVGFHGHDNLALALANTIAAEEAGATFLDGTLYGVGRDAGNTQLELLAAALRKQGYGNIVDPMRLTEIADEMIAALFPAHRGVGRKHLELGTYDILTHGLELYRSVASDWNREWTPLAEAFQARKLTFESEDAIRRIAEEIFGERRA